MSKNFWRLNNSPNPHIYKQQKTILFEKLRQTWEVIILPEEEKKEEKKGTLPEDVQKEFLAASKKAGTKDVAERAAELEGKIPTKKKEE